MSNKTHIVIYILLCTLVPLLIALIGIPYAGCVAICLFFSAMNADAIPIAFVDGLVGSVKKKNIVRPAARRWFVGFAAGLFLFSSVFSVIREINSLDTTFIPYDDTAQTLNTKTGNLDDFENSVITEFNRVSSYKVIIESTEQNGDTFTRLYGMYPSKDMKDGTVDNSAVVAKISLTYKEENGKKSIFSFTTGLPYGIVTEISDKTKDATELARLSLYIIKGIMPDLSDSQAKKLYKDMYLPDADEYERIGKENNVAVAWTLRDRVSVVRFGTENLNMLYFRFVEGASLDMYAGRFRIEFMNPAAEAGLE